MQIRAYERLDFNQLCQIMDMARKQELANEDLEETFVSLRDAPYLDYFLSLNILVATIRQQLVGFVGYGRHHLEFLYVDPANQNKGIGSALMKHALDKMTKPVKLSVFSNNQSAKHLYEKFGFKTVDTTVEKWSDEIPKYFSEDAMELK